MPNSASTKVPTKRGPAVRAKPKPKPPAEPETDVEVLGYDETLGTFDAALFGTDEVFTFWADANFLGMLIIYGGEGEDLARLSDVLKGMMYVDDDADEGVRRETWDRFVRLLFAQRKMGAERSMRFINDLIAAAGKDQQTSADD